MRTESFLHPLCLVRELAQYWHLISICMLGKFIFRLFFKCCFHFFVFPTEQIASALYCALQASILIEQGIPFSLYVARKQSFHPLLSVTSYWQSSSLSLLGLAWIIVAWVNYAYGYYTGEHRMWKQAAMSLITLTGLRGLHLAWWASSPLLAWWPDNPCWPVYSAFQHLGWVRTCLSSDNPRAAIKEFRVLKTLIPFESLTFIFSYYFFS